MHIFTSSRLSVVAASFLLLGTAGADQSYQVRKGDNLYQIGRKHGVSYQEIMRANQLKDTMIYPGQKLVIPTPQAEPVVKQVPQVAASPRQVPTVVPARNKTASSPVAGRVNAPPPPLQGGPSSSPIQPNDPVAEQPFASATPVTPSTSRSRNQPNEEDPLGLGYRPTSPYQNAPSQTALPHQPYASASKVTRPRKRIGRDFPPILSRSREVPAVAHYPEGPPRVFELDPNKFPTPSFSNAQRATGAPVPMQSYTVQPGDTMWKVSRKFGVSPIKVRRVNNLSLLTRIHPGMELRIP